MKINENDLRKIIKKLIKEGTPEEEYEKIVSNNDNNLFVYEQKISKSLNEFYELLPMFIERINLTGLNYNEFDREAATGVLEILLSLQDNCKKAIYNIQNELDTKKKKFIKPQK